MCALIGGPHLFPCRPPPKRGQKESPGIIPGQYATIVRQPGWNAAGRQMLARQRARELCEKARAAHVTASRNNAAREQLEWHAGLRHQAGRARQRLSLALRAADADLSFRRQRLQNLLMTEDSQLTAELVHTKQQAPLKRLQEQLKAVMDAKAAEAEAERKEVERLRLIQYREQCVELRDQKKYLADHDAKDVQLYQVHERAWLNQIKREDDQFWADVAKKNICTLMEAEEEFAQAAHSRNLQVARDNLALCEAVKSGAQRERLSLMEEEARFLDAMDKQTIKEKQEEAEKRLADQAAIAKALSEQRAEERAKHQWIEEAERRFDLAALVYADGEVLRYSQGKRDRKEQQRRESRLFREYRVEEKRLKEEVERTVDAAYNSVAADANRCRERRRTEFKQAIADLEKETYAVRAQQMDEKRAEAARCAEADTLERCRVEEMRREHMAYEDNARQQERERQNRYAMELKEQQQYKRLLKERECQLEKERLAVQCQEAQEQLRRAKVILDNPVPQPPHPLMESLARYPPPRDVNQAPDMSAPCWPVDPCGLRDPPVSFASDAAAAAAVGRGVPGAMAAAAAAAQRESAPPARVTYPSIAETCRCCGGVRYPPPKPCENCERLKHTRAAYAVGRKLWGMDMERQTALPALAMSRAAQAGITNTDPVLDSAVERCGAGSGVTYPPPLTVGVHAPPPAQPMLPDPKTLAPLRVKPRGLPQTLVVHSLSGGLPFTLEPRGLPTTGDTCQTLVAEQAAVNAARMG